MKEIQKSQNWLDRVNESWIFRKTKSALGVAGYGLGVTVLVLFVLFCIFSIIALIVWTAWNYGAVPIFHVEHIGLFWESYALALGITILRSIFVK